MKRWFWYLSLAKVDSLKKPKKGLAFFRQKLESFEVEFGVPWAKLKIKTSSSIENSELRRLERIEKEIYHNHNVLKIGTEVNISNQLSNSIEPLFFEYSGQASKLVLRESYKGEQGDCVFIMAGHKNDVGVLLLGSGANIIGSAETQPRIINPSIDPVGTLLAFIDKQALGTSTHKAGLGRPYDDLPTNIYFGFSSAINECKKSNIFRRVKTLAIFSAIIDVKNAPRNLKFDIIPSKVRKILIGSPIYVEQLDIE